VTSFWIGVLCGAWIGAPLGFMIAAILAAGRNADKEAGIE